MKWRTLTTGVPVLERLRRLAPHERLGIAATASLSEIRAAYRKQARIYHPDAVDPFLRRHGEEVMKLLNAAYRSMVDGVNR